MVTSDPPHLVIITLIVGLRVSCLACPSCLAGRAHPTVAWRPIPRTITFLFEPNHSCSRRPCIRVGSLVLEPRFSASPCCTGTLHLHLSTPAAPGVLCPSSMLIMMCRGLSEEFVPAQPLSMVGFASKQPTRSFTLSARCLSLPLFLPAGGE